MAVVVLASTACKQGVSFDYNQKNVTPSIQITSTEQSLTTNQAVPITIQFNTAVTGFTQDDVIATGATIQNFAGSGTIYQLNVVPYSVNFSIQILPDVATSTTGHGNLPSQILNFVYQGQTSVQNAALGACFDPKLYMNKKMSLDF
jgi:hypothetical protein